MSMTTDYADGALTISRLYDAPREVVFEAWVEVAKVQQWWGCADTTKVRSDIDRHVGGKYCHVMTIHGNNHNAAATITNYDPPNQLAYETEATDYSPKMSVVVSFTEENGKTRVTLVHSGLPGELSEIVTGGWSAGLGKLDDFLMRDAA